MVLPSFLAPSQVMNTARPAVARGERRGDGGVRERRGGVLDLFVEEMGDVLVFPGLEYRLLAPVGQ